MGSLDDQLKDGKTPMRRLLVVLSVAMLSMASCATNRDRKAVESAADQRDVAEPNALGLAPPGPLDDNWSRWLAGEWECSAESDIPGYKGWVKGKGLMNAELGLGGQFLIVRKEGQMVEVSEKYIRYLRETLHASDAQIEQLRNMRFGNIEFRSIDPENDQIIAYLFDSWRCVARGSGTCDGNEEAIQWEWSLAGGGTSVRTTEKISDDKLTITEKYTLPDGGTMEDRVQMIRKRSLPGGSGNLASLAVR
jgi:hypothetical protein